MTSICILCRWPPAARMVCRHPLGVREEAACVPPSAGFPACQGPAQEFWLLVTPSSCGCHGPQRRRHAQIHMYNCLTLISTRGYESAW